MFLVFIAFDSVKTGIKVHENLVSETIMFEFLNTIESIRITIKKMDLFGRVISIMLMAFQLDLFGTTFPRI